MVMFRDISVLINPHEDFFWQLPEQCSSVGTARIKITKQGEITMQINV
ncbi:hypothetical protein NIES2100_45270 [Calothrix sp. NIES-2100]|nr:hypothetical protein NIES2100_45270 [Calothrix sp. NIES-2100]